MNEYHKKMRSTKISETNRNVLRSICSKDESYDSAITKLIELARISSNAAARRKFNNKNKCVEGRQIQQLNVNRVDSDNGYNKGI